MLLGCIGDDFTGSSDLANMLAKNGLHTVQYSGVPSQAANPEVQAGVVALKSRSIEKSLAVKQSLEALEWLRQQGCTQYFFKYCSTFDSTPEGNIGPVIDALAEALNADRVIVCPAFPGTGRSVYQGHLFVNDTLLSESGMQNHPLTPMTDPDIRRWLGLQTVNKVGHVSSIDVLKGASHISAALDVQHEEGCRLIVVDALQDADLFEIGESAADLVLLTGGSGLAIGLPRNFQRRGQAGSSINAWRGQAGKCVVLSGSCSEATRAQVEFHARQHPVREMQAADIVEGTLKVDEVVQWLLDTDGLPLVFTSADPASVAEVQSRYGREKTANAIELFFSALARAVVDRGISKILTAGGETSGAVVDALGIVEMEIGPEIDPGVPALRSGPDLVLALKSGNFGSMDYFEKAARILDISSNESGS